MMRFGGLQLHGSRRGIAALTAGALMVAAIWMGVIGVRAAGADDAVTLGYETEASYIMGAGDTEALAHKLALFRAKRKAVYLAADEFARRRLIQFLDRDKNELVHLAADRLQAEPSQKQCRAEGQSTVCTVRVHAQVRLSDFIDAQLTSLQLNAEEGEEGYRDEMEPQVPAPLPPGQALAKAYRMIDKKELRMAIIYLDRLLDHYPNWWELYEVKATTLGLQNRFIRKMEALRKACDLGSPTACAQLKGTKE